MGLPVADAAGQDGIGKEDDAEHGHEGEQAAVLENIHNTGSHIGHLKNIVQADHQHLNRAAQDAEDDENRDQQDKHERVEKAGGPPLDDGLDGAADAVQAQLDGGNAGGSRPEKRQGRDRDEHGARTAPDILQKTVQEGLDLGDAGKNLGQNFVKAGEIGLGNTADRGDQQDDHREQRQEDIERGEGGIDVHRVVDEDGLGPFDEENQVLPAVLHGKCPLSRAVCMPAPSYYHKRAASARITRS